MPPGPKLMRARRAAPKSRRSRRARGRSARGAEAYLAGRRIRQASPGPVLMHGSSERSCLWMRVFAAPILLAAATVIGLSAALLRGRGGQYVVWLTVWAQVWVIAGV